VRSGAHISPVPDSSSCCEAGRSLSPAILTSSSLPCSLALTAVHNSGDIAAVCRRLKLHALCRRGAFFRSRLAGTVYTQAEQQAQPQQTDGTPRLWWPNLLKFTAVKKMRGILRRKLLFYARPDHVSWYWLYCSASTGLYKLSGAARLSHLWRRYY
jgi:hypothetical protein